MDRSGASFEPRYSPKNEGEIELFGKLDFLVKFIFGDYQRLDSHFLTKEYSNVIIEFEDSRNVFHLLFADHDN